MKSTIILFLLFSALNYSQTQWIETYGPSCGNITAFACEGDTLFAGTQGYGIYRSTNNGRSWQGIFNNSLNDSAFINSIAVSGNNVFAATAQGIFLSTNCGLNWSAVNNGLPSNPYIRTVGVKNNKIYIGVYNNQFTVAYGVYRSVDNGSNWAQANNGIGGNGLAVSCFNVCGNNILVATNNDVYISTNDGDSWSWVDMGLVNFSVVYSIASTGSNVYAGTYEGVLYSSNGGYNWTHIGPAYWYTMTVAVSGNKLFAGVANGSSTNPVNAMYVTSNNGGNWVHMTEGVPPNVRPIVIVTNANRVYCGLFQNGYLPLSSYPSGIYYSSDLGSTWEIRNDGIPLSSVKALAELNGTIFSGTEISYYFGLGGIQATTNEGNNWTYLDYTDSLLVGSKQFLKMSDTIYSAFPRVLKSTNSGVNWFNASNGLGESAYSLTSIGNTIFAGLYSISTAQCTQCGVYRSTDYGNSWTSVTMNVSNPKIRYLKSVGTRLFAVTQYNGIFTSDNYGANWVPNSLSTWVSSIEELNGLIFAGDGSGVSVSSDSGNTWTRVNSGLTNTSVMSLAKYGNLLFAATSGGVFYTSNNGANWADINSGFPYTMTVNTLLPTNSYLYAGTDERGVWKYPIWTLLPSVTISGTVRYQDDNQPVSIGKVKALRYDRITGNIITVDSAQIQFNGQYDLLHVPQDSTFIMAYPNDDFDFVPTYYPSATDWRQATILYPVGNLTNIDIAVFRISNSVHPYTVSGKVYKSMNNYTPVKDAIIYARRGNTYTSFDISSGSGSYIVRNLDTGLYSLSANRIGYNPVSKDVRIGSASLDSINFYMINLLVGTGTGHEVIPEKYSLYQNYPNPFNPATTIKFDLPKAAFTTLVVYDILGREVSTLLNEVLKAGEYKVPWNGSNSASGIYFFKLQSGEFIETRKMVLLK